MKKHEKKHAVANDDVSSADINPKINHSRNRIVLYSIMFMILVECYVLKFLVSANLEDAAG